MKDLKQEQLKNVTGGDDYDDLARAAAQNALLKEYEKQLEELNKHHESRKLKQEEQDLEKLLELMRYLSELQNKNQ